MEITLPYYLKRHADPLMSFRFLVEVDGDTVGAFSQFSGIKMEVQTIQARSGNNIRGVQTTIPVLTSFAPVTLTKGVFGSNAFISWIFSAAASSYTGPTGANLRRTIDVVADGQQPQRGAYRKRDLCHTRGGAGRERSQPALGDHGGMRPYGQ